MKILLIEDDPDIIQSLLPALKDAGYIADSCSDGEKGCFAAQTGGYDLVLLDYNLPKMNGREIIGRMRDAGSSVPIIMLTIHDALEDKVDLLQIGADDYLAKPFSLSELLARMKAVLRRPKTWEGAKLKLNSLEVDTDRFIVTNNGQRVFMTSKEFALLEYLLKNKGRVMSRQSIMEHVWDENADPFSNTIEVHIRNLRRKLESDGRPLIFTISNRGYKIDEAM